MTPLPPLSPAQALAVILRPVSICHRTLGHSEKKKKSVFKPLLLPISTRERYQWSPGSQRP